MKIQSILYISAVVISLASCGTTDVTLPVICDEVAEGSVSALAEIEAEAGTSITLIQSLCDNEELGEVKWDIHSAEGHSHEGEEEEGFTLYSGSDFAVIETLPLSGTSDTTTITLGIPNSSRGVWDIVISFSDAEGNEAESIITPLHIENSHIPLFTLADIDGEQHWGLGTTQTLIGTVSDSNGVTSAEVLLVYEEDESVVWSAEIETNGDTFVDFTVDVEVAAELAAGEYHLELEATDSEGVSMHTGFHVEVE